MAVSRTQTTVDLRLSDSAARALALNAAVESVDVDESTDVIFKRATEFLEWIQTPQPFGSES